MKIGLIREITSNFFIGEKKREKKKKVSSAASRRAVGPVDLKLDLQ